MARIALRGLWALAAGGSLLLGLVPGAHAEADFGGFQAFTVASGVRGTYSVGGFAISEPLDLGGPVAQATLDSLAGRAFGSVPYPGDTAVRYPGYVALATGSAPPGYPLFVEAQHPNSPDGGFADPAGRLTLAAKAASDSATGMAAIRGGAGEAPPVSTATTSVKRDSDKLVATAESVDRGVDVGGALQIGTVVSRSVTTYSPGAQPTTETMLRIEGGRAGEQTFAYGPGGLTVASAGVPLPARDGLAALNKALEPAGLALSFADAVPITGGAQSAGLVVEKTADVPGGGPGRFRLRFGQATSAIVIEGSAVPAAGAAGPSPLPVTEAPAPDGTPGAQPDGTTGASDFAAPGYPESPLVDAVPGAEGFAAPALPQSPGFDDVSSATASTSGTPASSGEETALASGAQPAPTMARLPAARAASASGLFDDRGDRLVFGAITAVALFGVATAMLWRRGMSQWTS